MRVGIVVQIPSKERSGLISHDNLEFVTQQRCLGFHIPVVIQNVDRLFASPRSVNMQKGTVESLPIVKSNRLLSESRDPLLTYVGCRDFLRSPKHSHNHIKMIEPYPVQDSGSRIFECPVRKWATKLCLRIHVLHKKRGHLMPVIRQLDLFIGKLAIGKARPCAKLPGKDGVIHQASQFVFVRPINIIQIHPAYTQELSEE